MELQKLITAVAAKHHVTVRCSPPFTRKQSTNNKDRTPALQMWCECKTKKPFCKASSLSPNVIPRGRKFMTTAPAPPFSLQLPIHEPSIDFILGLNIWKGRFCYLNFWSIFRGYECSRFRHCVKLLKAQNLRFLTILHLDAVASCRVFDVVFTV